MNKTNYDKLSKSLERLKDQYENFLRLDQKNLSAIDEEAVKESVIQRFEVCYDTLFKSLTKYLREEEALIIDSVAPKAVLRKACESGLINQKMLAGWFEHIKLRVGTTHDYSSVKAEQALSKMNDFIRDVEYIYRTIISKTSGRADD